MVSISFGLEAMIWPACRLPVLSVGGGHDGDGYATDHSWHRGVDNETTAAPCVRRAKGAAVRSRWYAALNGSGSSRVGDTEWPPGVRASVQSPSGRALHGPVSSYGVTADGRRTARNGGPPSHPIMKTRACPSPLAARWLALRRRAALVVREDVGGRAVEGAFRGSRETHVVTVRTSDRDEAQERVEEVFLPNRLDPAAGAAFDLRLDATRVGSVTVARMSFGGDVRLTTAEAAQYHVNLPLAGRAVSRMARGPATVAGPGQGAAFVPGHPGDVAWLESCSQLCLMIPKDSLEVELEQLTGTAVRAPIALEPAMDLSSPMAGAWRESLKVVLSEFETGPGLASHPVAGKQLERVIIEGLLLGHRHNYSGLLLEVGTRPSSRTIRQAQAFLEDQPEAHWTTVRLAARVHVSVRTLQHAFASDLGVAPMAYLRQVRLRRAHEALVRSSPDRTTVAAVAAGLGFTHLGRFAAAYRTMYGENPSKTLYRP